MVAIFNILYLIIFFFFVLCGIFIIYHIIRYSFSRLEAVVTLAIFSSVFIVLLLSNLILYSSLRLERLFYLINY